MTKMIVTLSGMALMGITILILTLPLHTNPLHTNPPKSLKAYCMLPQGLVLVDKPVFRSFHDTTMVEQIEGRQTVMVPLSNCIIIEE